MQVSRNLHRWFIRSGRRRAPTASAVGALVRLNAVVAVLDLVRAAQYLPAGMGEARSKKLGGLNFFEPANNFSNLSNNW